MEIVPAHLGRHEFLDASREPGRWEKAQDISRKAGGLTLNMIMKALGQLMSQQLGKLPDLSAVVSSQRLLGEDASQHCAAYRTQRPKKRSQHIPCGE